MESKNFYVEKNELHNVPGKDSQLEIVIGLTESSIVAISICATMIVKVMS
ncbi:MAG: hypothetical protein WCC82_02195 [Nitrososphaeraceae archaeon]